MESLIHAFGIDGNVLIAQTINFIVLVVLLTWILYKPVLKIVREREELIAKGVEDARAHSEMKVKAEEEILLERRNAQHDAQALIDSAKKEAGDERTRLVKEAHDHATRMISDARMRASDEASKIHKEAQKDIARLAVLAAEKIVRKS